MTKSLASIIAQNIRVGEDEFTGRNIKHRRWMLGMTRDLLGYKIGVTAEEVEEFESGARHIAAHELCEIAVALGVSTTALTNGFETYAYEVEERAVASQSRDEASALLAQVLATYERAQDAALRA